MLVTQLILRNKSKLLVLVTQLILRTKSKPLVLVTQLILRTKSKPLVLVTQLILRTKSKLLVTATQLILRSKSKLLASYAANPAQRKASFRTLYSANPNAKRLASRILYAKSRAQKNKLCSEHYREHQSLLCFNRRNRYRLAEPKRRVKDLYANVTQRYLVLNKARIEVVKVVRKRFPIVVKRNLVSRIASGYAARRLVNKSLRVRKEHAGNLLKATREITPHSIKGEKDFGETIHTASSEPYFHDSAYQQVQRHTAVPIDERGRCFVTNGVSTMVRVDKTETGFGHV